MKILAEKLKELRKGVGLNQTAVAQSLGLTYFTLGKWEQGRAEPSAEDLVKLAEYFDVTVDYLLGRESDYVGQHIKPLREIKSDNGLTLSPKGLSADETELLENFRKLDIYQQGAIKIQVKALAEQGQKVTK